MSVLAVLWAEQQCQESGCPDQFCKSSHSSSVLIFGPHPSETVLSLVLASLNYSQCIIVRDRCNLSFVRYHVSPVQCVSLFQSFLYQCLVNDQWSCVLHQLCPLCQCHLNICERTRPLFPRRLKKQGQQKWELKSRLLVRQHSKWEL